MKIFYWSKKIKMGNAITKINEIINSSFLDLLDMHDWSQEEKEEYIGKILATIETRILSRAIKDYLSRNQFFNEGQNLPSLTTEFFIYRKKEKHLLKSHGQNIYGMYDRNVFSCFLDEEIDLKNFIG